MPWFAGVERNEINWHPTIDKNKCVKCGMCMNCGKNVFGWDSDGKAVVQNPLDCVVGCSTCANLCLGNAIGFPPLEKLRAVFRKKKIWTAVRKQLVKEDKIPARHHNLKEELPEN